MIAAVRDGKLLTMEGDYDHIVNRGSLCVKGISMFATHASPKRLTTPRYRAPGSDHWEDISWDDAIARVAQKIRKTRDATWIASEKVDDKLVPVNRTDAIGFLGGAQNTNEECYLPEGSSAARPGLRRAPPTLTQRHGPRSGGLVWEGDDQPLD